MLHKIKLIELTRGFYAVVDEADFEVLNRHKWLAHKSKRRWYARRRDGKRHILMHRVIMEATPGILVDHRDGDGLNNQRSNLRFATNSQNQMAFQSTRQNKTSKFRGVYWEKACNKWRARLQRKHLPSISLGVFVDETDAARAYDAGALVYFGEFAALNLPKALEMSTVW